MQIARTGTYEIIQRERPPEAPSPMRARVARLKIAGIDQQKAVPEGAPGISFSVRLPAGSARMETFLEGGPDGRTRGAYYVDVYWRGH